MDEGPSFEAILTVVLSLGLGVVSVLTMPVMRSWSRWALNILVLGLPVLAVLVLVAAWLRP